jgi:chondroitin 4-sulfotransferase 11
MPVSHELKCIFVHIPRTGGTSVETALGVFGDWRIENTQTMFGLISSPELAHEITSTAFLQHLTGAQLRHLLQRQFEQYFRFSIVRNPWERMVSIYSHMDTHMAESAKQAGLSLTGISFDEFLERTESFQHVHLVPQHNFIFDSDGKCPVDFIGRFETLQSDFAEVCTKLGIESALSHRNASTHGDYRKYYSEASRKIVERRYGEDIERLRYTF